MRVGTGRARAGSTLSAPPTPYNPAVASAACTYGPGATLRSPPDELRIVFVSGSETGVDGGGIWGWGGVSIDPIDGNVYAATGNIFTTPESGNSAGRSQRRAIPACAGC